MYNIYLKNIKDLIAKRKETGPVEESNYLSSVIKNRRTELKLTLSDTTHDICSEAFLSKVERNLMNPKNERVEMLCERLDLDYNTLINLESNDRIEKMINLFMKDDYESIINIEDETLKGVFIAQDEIIKCYKYFINKDFKSLHLSIINIDNVKECLSDIELFALLLILFETYFYTMQYSKAKEYMNYIINIKSKDDKYILFIKERNFILSCKMNMSNIEYLFEDIKKNFQLYSMDKQISLLIHYNETLNTEKAYNYILDMESKYIPKNIKKEYNYAKILLLTKLNKNVDAMKQIIECGEIHIRFACLYAYNLLMYSLDNVNTVEVKKYKGNLISYIKLCNQGSGELYHIAFLRLMQHEIDCSSPEVVCNYIKNHLLKELKGFTFPIYDDYIIDRYCLLLGKLCRYKDAYLYLLEMKMHLKK